EHQRGRLRRPGARRCQPLRLRSQRLPHGSVGRSVGDHHGLELRRRGEAAFVLAGLTVLISAGFTSAGGTTAVIAGATAAAITTAISCAGAGTLSAGIFTTGGGVITRGAEAAGAASGAASSLGLGADR